MATQEHTQITPMRGRLQIADDIAIVRQDIQAAHALFLGVVDTMSAGDTTGFHSRVDQLEFLARGILAAAARLEPIETELLEVAA